MTWIKLDDGAGYNHKLAELTDREHRALIVGLWGHCARRGQQGYFRLSDLKHASYNTPQGPRCVTPKDLRRFIELELVDPQEDGEWFQVHDWPRYQISDPTAAARIRKHRETHVRPDPGRWKRTRAAVFERDKGICKDCGKDCSKPSDDGRDLWNADHDPPRNQLVAAGESIYDLRFIHTRCHSCHAKKTRRQATRDPITLQPEPDTEP